MNDRLEHQKALEATEMRIRSELEKSSKTLLQQLEAQLKALEVSHDRLQKKNSEDSNRFADGQERAAQQLVNLQEALTQEIEKGKKDKDSLFEAMEKEKQWLQQIDELKKKAEETDVEISNLNRRLAEVTESGEKNIADIEHKNELEKKKHLDLINVKIEQITELESVVKKKDSEILDLKTKRDEHVREIETNVITELRKVFNDSVVQ